MAGLVRDELVRALQARVRLFRMTLDRDAVLTPEALRQAQELMRRVPDPARDPEAVRAVATLHHCRWLLLGEDGRQDRAIADALERFAGSEVSEDGGSEPDRDLGGLLDQALTQLKAAERSRSRALLDPALQAVRAALDALPPQSPALRAQLLSNLGLALRLRHDWTGSLQDLGDAVAALRRAESEAGSGHPDRVGIVSALGVALRERYERTGALEDLTEAVRLARAAAAATPEGAYDHGGRLHNLGLALRHSFERTGALRDLTHAVQAHREAVGAAPSGHPGCAMFRQGLGNALHALFQRTGAVADLDAALEAYQQAVAVALPGDPLRPMMILSLAAVLLDRHEHSAGGADAERAEALLREAAAALPEEHPMYAAVQDRLGHVLQARGRDGALACHRTAALHPAASPHVRIRAAYAWGLRAMAAGDAVQGADAYERVVRLLPQLAPRNLAPGDAEHALAVAPGVAGDAAACAIEAEDAERALALLELGRGVLLGRGLIHQGQVAELRARAPELAERFGELRAALDSGDDSVPTDVRHALAEEWDQLLDRIRALPGFESFLLPPPTAQLLEQAQLGPVVVVNVSRHRCDALALTSHGLRVIALPQLSLRTALERTVAFLTALERLSGLDGADLLAQPAYEDELDDGLRWLWDTVAGPVLDALGMLSPPAPGAGSLPRVWWVPTGPLAFLPLHAAGHHREAAGRTVLDRAVSSYAPTVRALAHARRPAPAGPGRFLVVAVPEAPASRPLPGAAAEAAALTRLLSDASLLYGEQAGREAVVTAVRDHNWLHFCGHGTAESTVPSGSRLLVHDHLDHPLTVAGISRLDLRDAELAYLSACTTARTGLHLADEAVHLVGALQLAGYRHVVGTLWAIDDTVSARIAERVYTELGAPRPVADRAAYAVHTAVRATRDRYPATPSLWAAHVHVGP